MYQKWTLGRILLPLIGSALMSGFLTSATIAMVSRRHRSICSVSPLRVARDQRGDIAA